MIRMVVYRPQENRQSSRFNNFDVIYALITRVLKKLPRVLHVDVSQIVWEVRIDENLTLPFSFHVECDEEGRHAAAKVVVGLSETNIFTLSWDVPDKTREHYEERLELDDTSLIVELGKDFMSKVPFVEG